MRLVNSCKQAACRGPEVISHEAAIIFTLMAVTSEVCGQGRTMVCTCARVSE